MIYKKIFFCYSEDLWLYYCEIYEKQKLILSEKVRIEENKGIMLIDIFGMTDEDSEHQKRNSYLNI